MLPSTAWGVTVSRVALWGQALLASAKSTLPPTIWDHGRDRVVAWVKDQALTRAKRTLEDRLASLIELANGHQARGLPPGSPAYLALHVHADRAIADFCAKQGVERLAVEQEAPALRDLEALTQPPSVGTRVAKGLGILLAGILGAIAIGGAGGLVATGYRWIVRLFGG
jgi:hypothetical protein